MYAKSISLTTTVQELRCGDADLADYVDAICDRVDTVNPAIAALLPESGRRERLRAEARRLQEQFPSPADRPPLFMVPVGVKDLFRVDGFPTRAGSALPEGLFAGPQASVVTALQEAGALVVGKTQTDEFAHSEPSPARNPHALAHSPGGSSAGSAAGVAAGLFPLALGTQTMRSVIGPAAFCGVIGFKPSYGRIPTDGVVFMSPSIDTVGFFTQDLDGIELAAQILIPRWRSIGQLATPRLGVPECSILNQLTDEARAAFEAQLGRLAATGFCVRRIQVLGDDEVARWFTTASNLLHAEMATVHADWFAGYGELYRPRTAAAVRLGQTISNRQLAAARVGQLRLRSSLEDAMGQAGIDAWVVPSSNGPAPLGLEVTGWVDTTGLWSYAGMPCLSLPVVRAAGDLPLGLQLIAPHGQDEQLLAWASHVERRLTS